MAKRPSYTKEFRERAVRLTTEDGVTVGEVAAQLGISESTLTNWRRRAGVAAPRGANDALHQQLREARAEIDDLRKRLRQAEKDKKMAEMEREILGKATAFFAKNHG